MGDNDGGMMIGTAAKANAPGLLQRLKEFSAGLVKALRPATTAAPPAEFATIQVLRGLAAAMVAAFHVLPRLERLGWHGAWPEWLSCGVDIFFVISGFIMWTNTARRPTDPATFLLRRFLRIAPMYYLVTTLTVVLLLVAPRLISSTTLDTRHALASFFFIPWPNPIRGSLEPVVPQGWTLNYEMEFYLLFAAALFFAPATRIRVLLSALVLIVLAGAPFSIATIPGFLSSSIILEFGLGIVIGALAMGGLRITRRHALTMLVIGVAAVPLTWGAVTGGVPRLFVGGLASALIVAGAVFLEMSGPVPMPRIFHVVGDASYSIYLTHGLILTGFAFAWDKLKLPVSPAVFAPPALATALIIGIGIFYAVERPLHRAARVFSLRIADYFAGPSHRQFGD